MEDVGELGERHQARGRIDRDREVGGGAGRAGDGAVGRLVEHDRRAGRAVGAQREQPRGDVGSGQHQRVGDAPRAVGPVDARRGHEVVGEAGGGGAHPERSRAVGVLPDRALVDHQHIGGLHRRDLRVGNIVEYRKAERPASVVAVAVGHPEGHATQRHGILGSGNRVLHRLRQRGRIRVNDVARSRARSRPGDRDANHFGPFNRPGAADQLAAAGARIGLEREHHVLVGQCLELAIERRGIEQHNRAE